MAGCKDPEPSHVHDYEWTVTTPATCIATGEETGVCRLDPSHTTTREIAALGHDWKDAWTTIPPTCTEGGFDTDTCNRNAEHTRTRAGTTAALGHDWNTETGLCNNNCGELYYELGDTGPGGGKIFYRIATGFTMTDDNSTAHYLEAAPNDMVTTLAWASTEYKNIAGTATGIGTGRKNTALILATEATAPAAKACNDYINGGKTDWFLPSKDELNQLYTNRTSVGNLKTTEDTVNTTIWNKTNCYWPSSQGNGNNTAWHQDFSNGYQGNNYKDYTYSVRAVRAF